MVLLKNPLQVFDYDDLQESLFELKEADCILYSEDGIEIDIHREILFQTKFMQSMLLSADNACCNSVQIFCPCPAHELEDLVKFLYSGKISYSTDNERAKLLDNLNKIFGFSKKLHFKQEEEEYTDENADTFMLDLLETKFNVIENNNLEQPIKEEFDEEQNMFLEVVVDPLNTSKTAEKNSKRERKRVPTKIKFKKNEKNPTGEKPYACNFCDRTFNNPGNLKQHAQKCAKQDAKNNTKGRNKEDKLNDPEKSKAKKENTSEKPFACNFCDRTFNNVGNKRQHEQVHYKSIKQEDTIDHEGIDTKENLNIKQEKVNTDEKIHACNFCDRKFRNLGTKTQHEKTHTSEKTFPCSFCEKKFTTPSNMRQHEEVHLKPTKQEKINADEDIKKEKKIYTCKKCDKQFLKKRHLRDHRRTHRTTIKGELSCKYCTMKFVLQDDMDVHAEKCEKEKQITCKKCDRRFALKSQLSNHVRIHGMTKLDLTPTKKVEKPKVKLEKTIFCEKCPKAYATDAALKLHQKLHEEAKYFCKSCPKQFHYMQLLQRHEKVHTGEKEYLCTFCGKAFSEMSNRNKHEIAIHSSEPKFSCCFCNKKFRWSVMQRKHQKKCKNKDKMTELNPISTSIENPFTNPVDQMGRLGLVF